MRRDQHWLYRPENRRKLWATLFAILMLSLVPEWFIHRHPHFPEAGFTLDAAWGFYAWYGFITCAAMVVAAKLLGFLLKRPEGYYDE